MIRQRIYYRLAYHIRWHLFESGTFQVKEKKYKILTDYRLHALRDCVHAVCDVSGFLVFLETDGGVATDAEA